MTSPYHLEMKSISKSFVGVKALQDVSLKVRRGTVHVLMGENGAGKSTLMKVLAGIHQPDEGDVFLNGKKIVLKNPGDALEQGISMIHQELSPVVEMTVGENIYLGREPLSFGGIINHKQMYINAEKLLKELQINVNPRIKMSELSVAGMQLVEIAKALSYDSEIIIMDEPTSAIADQEVEKLFEIINLLTSQGKSIIYISHKMDEIYRIADDITIFRDGLYIDTQPAKLLDYETLIKKMVGRELTNIYPENDNEVRNQIVLRVKNLSSPNTFKKINFELKKGEILGVTGLMGAGRTEIAEAIFGMRPISSGEIFIDEEKVVMKSPEDAIKNRLAFITENRKDEGLFLPLSIRENMSICSLSDRINGGFIKQKEEVSIITEIHERLRVKAYSIHQTVETLSGGNQQKVVIGKWLLTNPNILILDEPTRGIDIGAKTEIYKLMIDLAKSGVSIIMISSEMPEVIGMSDRIVVISEGVVTGELSKKEATQEKILSLATEQIGVVS